MVIQYFDPMTESSSEQLTYNVYKYKNGLKLTAFHFIILNCRLVLTFVYLVPCKIISHIPMLLIGHFQIIQVSLQLLSSLN